MGVVDAHLALYRSTNSLMTPPPWPSAMSSPDRGQTLPTYSNTLGLSDCWVHVHKCETVCMVKFP